jgi:hypothetical protein
MSLMGHQGAEPTTLLPRRVHPSKQTPWPAVGALGCKHYALPVVLLGGITRSAGKRSYADEIEVS